MQALADVLLGLGNKITGTDIQDFPGRGRLEDKGATVIVGEQKAANIPSGINGLIYTSAVAHHGNKHPEVERAKEMGVLVWKRSEFIGELMKDKTGIAISGTHGKTTTATLITLMLQEGGLDPTALIGAEVKSLAGCGILGQSQYMVVEACEYDRAFLDMHPTVAVLTNIDNDHLDYYQSMAAVKQAFTDFLNLIPPTGWVVVCGDDPNVKEILPHVKAKIITYGFDPTNDWVAKNVGYHDGKMVFEVDGIKTFLNFPGKHLVLDALAAITVARQLGVSYAAIKKVLETKFQGAARRFEILGEVKGVTFMDDYAHHPTEIKVTLAAAKEYFKNRKIRVVFQAHQYSRTRLLLTDFARSFQDADEVMVAPILAVRDSKEDMQAIDTNQLAEAITTISHNAKAYGGFEEIGAYLKESLQPGEVVLALGAGKSSDWVREFMDAYKR